MESLDPKRYFETEPPAPTSYVEALALEEDDDDDDHDHSAKDDNDDGSPKAKKAKLGPPLRRQVYSKKGTTSISMDMANHLESVKCVDAEHVRQKTAKCTVCGVCRFCPAGADECAATHRVLRPMTNKTRAPRAKVLLCENEEHHHKKTHRGKCVRCLKCKWCPPVIDECKEFHVDPETSMTPTKVEHTVKLESILSILDIAKGKLVQVKPRDVASSTPKRRLACELMTHVVHSVAHLIVEPNRKKPEVTIEGLGTLLDDLRRDLRGHPPSMQHFATSRHSSGSSSASSETSQVMSIIL